MGDLEGSPMRECMRNFSVVKRKSCAESLEHIIDIKIDLFHDPFEPRAALRCHEVEKV